MSIRRLMPDYLLTLVYRFLMLSKRPFLTYPADLFFR